MTALLSCSEIGTGAGRIRRPRWPRRARRPAPVALNAPLCASNPVETVRHATPAGACRERCTRGLWRRRTVPLRSWPLGRARRGLAVRGPRRRGALQTGRHANFGRIELYAGFEHAQTAATRHTPELRLSEHERQAVRIKGWRHGSGDDAGVRIELEHPLGDRTEGGPAQQIPTSGWRLGLRRCDELTPRCGWRPAPVLKPKRGCRSPLGTIIATAGAGQAVMRP